VTGVHSVYEPIFQGKNAGLNTPSPPEIQHDSYLSLIAGDLGEWYNAALVSSWQHWIIGS
jgi:hypothetical protein